MRLELWINDKFWDYADTGNFYTTPELLKTVVDQLKKDNERFIIDADWEIIVTKKSRLKHLNTPATITEKGEYRIVEGKILTEDQFKKKYPMKLRPRLRQLQNIDNTKKWML